GRSRFAFAQRVIDLPRLRIDDIGHALTWACAIFLGPWRCRWQLDHLARAAGENEGDVCIGHCRPAGPRTARRELWRPSAGKELLRQRDRADAPARERQPAID